MLARLRLQRQADVLSSRYVVVERVVTFRSPILLTPFRDDGLIDVATLERFVADAYDAANVRREAIDTGAVILTGKALERANARAIADLFSAEGGRFVCASAGHRLEAILSAHGSGAVDRSRDRNTVVLNIDVGGGTTKLGLCVRGEIASATAIGAGARVDLPVAQMADAIVDAARGRTTALDLLPPLAPAPAPDEIVFSGGVSEHLYGRDRTAHGDAGLELAAAIRQRAGRLPAPIAEGREGIHATVVGASQFTVQVSGSTIFVSDRGVLPLRNVPVVRAAPDALAAAVAARVEQGGPLALAIDWQGLPRHDAIRALGERIRDAAGGHRPLVVALAADVAHTLGRVLTDELGVTGALVVIDGLDLRDLDYIDVGEIVTTANVVPVVIKSLVFAG